MTTNPKQKLVPVVAWRFQYEPGLQWHVTEDAERIGKIRREFSLAIIRPLVEQSAVEASPAIPSGEQMPCANIDALVVDLIWEADRIVKQAARGEREADGKLYDTTFRHIVTKHLVAAETPEERQAKIVAWLRGQFADEYFDGPTIIKNLANAIESGDYLRTGGGE